MKVMIHAVPKRLWYVENYLIPSIDGDVSVWVDDKGLGNLQSCMAAFASCKGGETWHLQDDVLLCRDFKERTEGLEGVVFGFCCEQFEDDPALIGRVYQETNLDNVVFPTPLCPTNNRCPIGCFKTRSIRKICSNTESNITKGTFNSSS